MGMMEKLSMERLKTLFATQIQMKSIECVIVSACHSQKIGEMMRDSGVPVVICINAPFKIQDEAARTFGKTFHQALVQGMTYQEAFDNARNFVRANQEPHEIYSCCCAHPHKPDCLWVQKAKEIGDHEAHLLHMPNCKCNLPGNLHYFEGKKLCGFADDFLENYATWDYYEPNEERPD